VRCFSALLLLTLASLVVSCGGGGSSVPPLPPGPFSEASLHGQYAFSMNGVDTTGGYLARVGSFMADGNGNIMGAIEDVLALGSGAPPSLVTFTGGNYQIQPNGRGIIVLQAGNGTGLQLNLSLQSTSRGFLLETDLNAASSGSFSMQVPGDFATSAISNNYVFDFSGVSFSGVNAAPISIIGQMITDGSGNVTGGTEDLNDGNQPAPSGPVAVTAGTYQLDSNTNGTNFGRGTMSFGGYSYVFYIVDKTHLKLMEEDSRGGTSGDAVQQLNTIPTQNPGFTGSFAYLVGGAKATGTTGPYASVGRFTSDGNGGIGAISLDLNNNGNTSKITQGSNISAANYTIDTAHPGSGRGTFTFKNSGQSKPFTYVFYMSSASQAVLQDTTAAIIADGTMLAQTGSPFTLAGSAGGYAFNWSGISLNTNGAIPFNENFVGQYTLTSDTSNNVPGVVDYTELGLSRSSFFSNVGLSGTLTIKNDGTGSNTLRMVVGGSSSLTLNFAAYAVDARTVLVMTTDSTEVTAGLAVQQ
jgi:hypothetical protein